MKPVKQINILYRQNSFPLFQNRLYDTPEEAMSCPTGDIELVEDLKTGLIYNTHFQPDRVVYDAFYNNEQDLSLYFQKHLEQVAQLIEMHMGRQSLLEVGCGKGFFLEMLLSRGFDISGFDPTYEGTNKRILKQYFAPGIMKPANGLILRHVLEHIPNPVDFLYQLKKANNNQGLIYIEVPCFDWICERRAWFDVFYEHVNYFRLTDFDRIFSQVIESGRIFRGQYLYIIASLCSIREPVINHNDRPQFPVNFMPIRAKFNTTAIWGGGSKGVIFSLLNARAGKTVDIVIDINPAKQGKYLPFSALQVSAPEQAMRTLKPGSTIYVMNSNYLNEIQKLTCNKYKLIGIDNEYLS